MLVEKSPETAKTMSLAPAEPSASKVTFVGLGLIATPLGAASANAPPVVGLGTGSAQGCALPEAAAFCTETRPPALRLTQTLRRCAMATAWAYSRAARIWSVKP